MIFTKILDNATKRESYIKFCDKNNLTIIEDVAISDGKYKIVVDDLLWMQDVLKELINSKMK